MKRFITFIIFCYLLPVSLFPNSQVMIDSAKNAYQNNEFEKAINYYEEILNSGYEAAEIYYNLANAYYKSNKLTLAIINYERALLLAPGDEEIQFNLNIAGKYVVDKIEVLPRLFVYDWVDSFLNNFSSDKWAMISIVSFIILLILLLIFFFTNIVFLKKASFWFGIILLFISAISFFSSAKQKKTIAMHNSAIIYSPSVTIKSSPDFSGNDLFVLHEGTKVSIEDSVKNWVEIKMSDGNKGWLQASDIVIL